MGKGLQIAIVALLYIVCAVGGFFLHDVVIAESDVEDVHEAIEETVVAEEPAKGAVPVIADVSVPKRGTTGKYGFSVMADVQTSDQLLYVIYSDSECLVEVAKSLDGKFSEIPSVSSAKYYVRVQNLTTKDLSEIVEVSGFVPITMYEKITKAELEKICNSGDFGTAPAKFNHRIMTGCQIVPQGMNSEERGVSTVADVCQKVMMGVWKSVTVESIEYDSQNRMKKLVLKVNY